MRRDWNTPRNRDAEGSQRSHELASALAQVADPDFIEKLIHTKAQLDSIGGQVFLVAQRRKYAVKAYETEDGIVEQVEVVTNDEPGIYETDGYILHYEHIPTALRQKDRPTEPDARLPIEDPPDDYALRDEIEAEVAAIEAEDRAQKDAIDEAADLPEGPDGSSFTGSKDD